MKHPKLAERELRRQQLSGEDLDELAALDLVAGLAPMSDAAVADAAVLAARLDAEAAAIARRVVPRAG